MRTNIKGWQARGLNIMADDADAFCTAQARTEDSDRFFAALFAKNDARADLMALSALNVELQRVRANTHETMLAEIRFQWWRDALQRLYDAPPDAHPVCVAMARAVKRTQLPRERLSALVEAHADGLSEDRRADPVEDARAPAAAMLALGTHITAPGKMEDLAAAIDAGSEALAHASALRAARRHAARAGHRHDGLAEASLNMADQTRAHLAAARAAFRKARVPRALPVFLPLALVPLDLAAKGAAEIPLHRKLLRLALAGTLGRF